MPAAAVGFDTKKGWNRPQLRRFLFQALIAGGTFWGGLRWWDVRRYRTSMAEIQELIDNGHNNIAATRLIELLAWKPDSDRAAYLLGICEQARGRTKQAAEAWARVRPGSPFDSLATQRRIERQIDDGRLADAEASIIKEMESPRAASFRLANLLMPMYRLEGRVHEAAHLAEATWNQLREGGDGASATAVRLLRLQIEVQLMPIPVETLRSSLDQLGKLAPEDDRIWLAKANLALRAGSIDEAAERINACLRRRPDDAAVWRARLNWAMAAGLVADARDAIKHLPPNESAPARTHRLTAWIAAHSNDIDAEQRALEQVIAADPADVAALDRLAEIAESRRTASARG